jgi:hypothetical protein
VICCLLILELRHGFIFACNIYYKVYTACSREINKIVPLVSLNKYLCNGESEIKLNVNNSSEKL